MTYNPNTKLPTAPPVPVVIVNNETGTPLDIAAITTPSGWKTVVFSDQVEVQSTSTQLLGENANRKYLHIVNNSDGLIYIQIGGDAAIGRGIRLNKGGMFCLSGYELFLGRINAISTSNIMIDVLEGE